MKTKPTKNQPKHPKTAQNRNPASLALNMCGLIKLAI